MSAAIYKRVVLKLSGEALAGEAELGINARVVALFSQQIKEIVELGVQVAIVVGGGNIWRGITGSKRGMDRATSDYMGMLATVLNALALQDGLEHLGVSTRVQTSFAMRQVAELYIRRRAIRHLEKGRVVIFAGGSGAPFFTTDTAAALRAAEIEADVLLMAKNNVDGVYSSDPSKDPEAVKSDRLTYLDLLNQELRVMDCTASSLCMDNSIKVVLFNVLVEGNIKRAVLGENIGTLISKGEQTE